MKRAGGCQCGAIRFAFEGELGGASICHCRMCQKAFGAFYGPFVTAKNERLAWTRGQLAHFQSSNYVRRGFCANCGTPLTYEAVEGQTEIAVGAFDDPNSVPITSQLSVHTKVAYVDGLSDLPARQLSAFKGELISYQHPDHDTDHWEPRS